MIYKGLLSLRLMDLSSDFLHNPHKPHFKVGIFFHEVTSQEFFPGKRQYK